MKARTKVRPRPEPRVLYQIADREPVPLRRLAPIAREVLIGEGGEGNEVCVTAIVCRVQIDGSIEESSEDAGWAVLDMGRVRFDLYASAIFPA